MGALILFDKPIIAVIPPGRTVSANLRRVASEIIEGDIADPGTKKRLEDAIDRVHKNDVRAKSPI